MDELEFYEKTFSDITNMLSNVQYELEARQYTLHEDEMAKIFYCRDAAYLALKRKDIIASKQL